MIVVIYRQIDSNNKVALLVGASQRLFINRFYSSSYCIFKSDLLCVLGQTDDIPHDLDSIRAANHFVHFFVEQARRMNDHKFANGRAEEEEHLIYNWYTK